MLSIKFVRENADLVRKAVADKGEKVSVDELLSIDEQRRRALSKVEELKNRRNVVSEQIGVLVKQGKDADALKAEGKDLAREIKELDAGVAGLQKKLDEKLMWVPNVPHESVPVGPDSSANTVKRTWGEQRNFGFKPLSHTEIASKLDIIDFPRSAKISGSGFALYKGQGARLERALVNFMLDVHTREHGYKEISPPHLVTSKSMTGTGQLPKLEVDMYRLRDDDLYLIPTAEVPVTNIFRDEVIPEEELPVYYTAYTPCYRREAGSYGKETKGLVRVHQFDKVELVKFVRPEDSYDELEKLLSDAEDILRRLGLAYRVSALSTGDLSFAAAKCYDIEAWAPGIGAYLEVSSCSNFEDFQARRSEIRYKPKSGKKTEYVHTLNGSGVALARTVVCILENYQNGDGSVTVPEALRPYMDNLEVLK